MHTDTLALNKPATRLQMRVTLMGKTAPGTERKGKARSCRLEVSRRVAGRYASRPQHLTPLEPNRSVWGKEIAVPGRTQFGWPGASGWCSPTSTAMALAFWAKCIVRNSTCRFPTPPTPSTTGSTTARATGRSTRRLRARSPASAPMSRASPTSANWKTGSPGLPPVVSVSYDLLKGKEKDNDPGHLMVCDGFTKDGDIVLNDPAHHPERGEAAAASFPAPTSSRLGPPQHRLSHLSRRRQSAPPTVWPLGTVHQSRLNGFV